MPNVQYVLNVNEAALYIYIYTYIAAHPNITYHVLAMLRQPGVATIKRNKLGIETQKKRTIYISHTKEPIHQLSFCQERRILSFQFSFFLL